MCDGDDSDATTSHSVKDFRYLEFQSMAWNIHRLVLLQRLVPLIRLKLMIMKDNERSDGCVPGICLQAPSDVAAMFFGGGQKHSSSFKYCNLQAQLQSREEDNCSQSTQDHTPCATHTRDPEIENLDWCMPLWLVHLMAAKPSTDLR